MNKNIREQEERNARCIRDQHFYRNKIHYEVMTK